MLGCKEGVPILDEKREKRVKGEFFQFWPPKNMIFRFFHENFQFLDFLTKTLKIL